MKRQKQLISRSFHRVEPSRFPKDFVSVYRDSDVEVVMAPRSYKYFYRFYVRFRAFVFWTEQTDLGYLQRIKEVRQTYIDKFEEVMRGLDVPSDVLPAKAEQLKNEGS